MDSPDQMKRKKTKISNKNNDEICFQYVATVALNFDEIQKDL